MAKNNTARVSKKVRTQKNKSKKRKSSNQRKAALSRSSLKAAASKKVASGKVSKNNKVVSISSKINMKEKSANMDNQVIELFRRWGHLKAEIDPLGNFQKQDYAPLDELNFSLYPELVRAYCSKVGSEFMHISFPDRCEWLAEKIEEGGFEFDELSVLKRIVSVEMFEKFLHTKYVGAKRFSLEGIAGVVPLLDAILDDAAEQGVEVVMLGMAHRGRLNVMHHIVDTLAEHIVANFEDVDPKSALGGDDVKYHKGAAGLYVTSSGKTIKVELAANPSHLEAVNPVVMGRARARQELMGDGDGSKVLCVLLHGDAAFSGQGIAAETLNYMSIPGFSVGGTINIILNNLIGFTATQPALYSGRYATDIAKRLEVPIMHVNADSPKDIIKVGRISSQYRAKFKSDFVIDLVGYRRYGHNEVDDPTLTSPVLYKQVKERPILCELYADEIGLSKDQLKQIESQSLELFEESLRRGREIKSKPNLDKLGSPWDSFYGGLYKDSYEVPTIVPTTRLSQVGEALGSTPAGFNLHPKLGKLLELRREMAGGIKPVDWGCAEGLAFGTLLQEGYPIRLVGQDCRRGTFTHRQAVLYDYETGAPYFSLGGIAEKSNTTLSMYDSMLSEAAAIGFEYGYTRENPNALVLWEAQFGDFVNGAQIIIDQFLSAAEDKWSLLSGLVLLLPHGYEGAGPEHSSARVERFLQLCAEDNMQVCQPSSASQYFHLLRRQAMRVWKKPLIVITPKSMLRLPAACSPISEFSNGYFHLVSDVGNLEFKNATRMLLCTGKVVHELRAERAKLQDKETAIVTVEQLYPTPERELRETLKAYPNLRSIVWVQDEPANMGALSFIKPSLDRVSNGIPVYSVKRSASASPATGSPSAHAMEQKALMNMAFVIGR